MKQKANLNFNELKSFSYRPSITKTTVVTEADILHSATVTEYQVSKEQIRDQHDLPLCRSSFLL